MRIIAHTWKDRFEGGGLVGFEVFVLDDYGYEIEVEGHLEISKENGIEVTLKHVGGERKFNSLKFNDKYKAHVECIKTFISSKEELLDGHIRDMQKMSLKDLGCHITETPEYYKSAIVSDFILTKNKLDNTLEIINLQGALLIALFNKHSQKFAIESFLFQYGVDLKKIHKIINAQILRDLSSQYLARIESLFVGEILDEEKMELLPLTLMRSPITIDENKGTIIPFELFIARYKNMSVKLGIMVANKFFKLRGYPETKESFFSAMEDERKLPTMDKSVLAQSHIILRVVLQGLEECLAGMTGLFTNLEKKSVKERIITFPTPSNDDLDNSLVYAIMTLEEHRGRPIKQLENTYFTGKKAKSA